MEDQTPKSDLTRQYVNNQKEYNQRTSLLSAAHLVKKAPQWTIQRHLAWCFSSSHPNGQKLHLEKWHPRKNFSPGPWSCTLVTMTNTRNCHKGGSNCEAIHSFAFYPQAVRHCLRLLWMPCRMLLGSTEIRAWTLWFRENQIVSIAIVAYTHALEMGEFADHEMD